MSMLQSVWQVSGVLIGKNTVTASGSACVQQEYVKDPWSYTDDH